MFQHLKTLLDKEYNAILSRKRILDNYTAAFQKLAEAEHLPVRKNRIRAVLSRYTDNDIERAYDAAVRFGLMAMLNNSL